MSGSSSAGPNQNIPAGFVAGDRVFVRLKDTGKEIYKYVAEEGYGEWLDVGVNGVRWGEGDGGVWVFTERTSLDEIAWGVLKMSFERMEKLPVRNVKVLRRKLKLYSCLYMCIR